MLQRLDNCQLENPVPYHLKDSQPHIETSLTIKSDLYITAFHQQKYQIDLSMNKVSDIRQIETLLLEIDGLPRPKITQNSETPQPTVTTCLENAIINLEQVIKLLDHDDLDFDTDEAVNENLFSPSKIGFHFLLDQLKFLKVSKFGRRYSVLTQVFSLKIHGISPACYRLIQSSNCLTLPHERNILKLKNYIGLDSDYLNVLKEFSSSFNDNERHVILQMDEVHIRSDASYKGGKIIGSIDHPEDPPTTVFSMVVSSFMKNFYNCTSNPSRI